MTNIIVIRRRTGVNNRENVPGNGANQKRWWVYTVGIFTCTLTEYSDSVDLSWRRVRYKLCGIVLSSS